MARGERRHRLLAVDGHARHTPEPFEESLRDELVDGVVLDDEDVEVQRLVREARARQRVEHGRAPLGAPAGDGEGVVQLGGS